MVKKSRNKIYVVEDILDTKIEKGKQFYKVKWQDYTTAQATWEPEQSFHCPKSALDNFLSIRAEKSPAFKQKLQRIQREKSGLKKSRLRKSTIDSRTRKITQQVNSSSSSSSSLCSQQQDLKSISLQSPKQTKQLKNIDIQILNVKKDGDTLKYIIRQGNHQILYQKEQMHRKYSKQLCQFYQKHLQFDS